MRTWLSSTGLATSSVLCPLCLAKGGRLRGWGAGILELQKEVCLEKKSTKAQLRFMSDVLDAVQQGPLCEVRQRPLKGAVSPQKPFKGPKHR